MFSIVPAKGHHPGQNGYSVNILQQNKILTEVTSTIKKNESW